MVNTKLENAELMKYWTKQPVTKKTTNETWRNLKDLPTSLQIKVLNHLYGQMEYKPDFIECVNNAIVYAKSK